MTASWISKFGLPLLLAVASALAPTAHAVNLFGPKEVTGIVFDAKTGAPTQGAFVLAVYSESGGTLFGHNSSWCVRTQGMWTDEQGRFTFPKGKDTDPKLHVIKEGYIQNPYLSTPSFQEIKTEPGLIRKLYLEPQALARLDSSKWVACQRPASREAVEANITYLQLLAKEDAARPGGPIRQNTILSAISALESHPWFTRK